ncbi:uncharacterized protein LOC129300346 isoform X1 [Prosopis cineraria]|uniref:uncharacterized protein LOC129300346 isoform X1 n=1 Tax=Prosopis cineraria TaxID=364024 RepID=UPI002410A9BC|nr:uncharacterized protein LOC129300346 isoform X1 [Prosopis cineraria]
MVRENDEMPLGWPLGLSFLYTRLRVAESLPVAPVGSYSLHVPSSSFSSFSSSNLDTESSASFFQDSSVSLGRLIGIRAGERRGHLYFPNALNFEEGEMNNKSLAKDGSKVHEQVDMSRGNICIPILLDALLLKTSRAKRSSRK